MKTTFVICNVKSGQWYCQDGGWHNSINNAFRFVAYGEAEAKIPIVIKKGSVLNIVKIFELEEE